MDVNKKIERSVITPLESIKFGVLLGHPLKLSQSGIIWWGTDGTYLLTRYFDGILSTLFQYRFLTRTGFAISLLSKSSSRLIYYRSKIENVW